MCTKGMLREALQNDHKFDHHWPYCQMLTRNVSAQLHFSQSQPYAITSVWPALLVSLHLSTANLSQLAIAHPLTKWVNESSHNPLNLCVAANMASQSPSGAREAFNLM